MIYEHKTSPVSGGSLSRTSMGAGVSRVNNHSVLNIKHSSKRDTDGAWSFACRVLLDDQCRRIIAAESNKRWPTFAGAAFMLAGFVADGTLSPWEVRLQLTSAALFAGMRDFTRVIDAAFFESTRPRWSGRCHG